MKPITKSRILRRLIVILTLPRRIIESLEAEANRQSCLTERSTQFLPGSLVVNFGNKELIKVGVRSLIAGHLQVLNAEAVISIGSYCYIGDHTRIWCAAGVTIGDRVIIAHNVNIHDNNAHSMSVSIRRNQTIKVLDGARDTMPDVKSSPIFIEEDVWIGFNSAILRGVRIGRGAIIGAGSIITKDVPPYAIIVGSPQRQVGVAPE